MMGATWLPISKEVRALLPTWMACAAAVVLAGTLGDVTVRLAGQLAFIVGAVALGALSIGHEYTGRTLGLLLSQPVSRGRLFGVKAGVAALMLSALAGVAWLVLFMRHPYDEGSMLAALSSAAMLVLPVAAGLSLAPALTMACRSPMAGVVFTVTALALLWASGGLLADTSFGPADEGASARAAFRALFVWRATLVLSALAALASWRLFARLEVIETRGPDMTVSRWRPRSRPEPLRSGWAGQPGVFRELVGKELHLQQITLVLGAIYIGWWMSVIVIQRAAAHALATEAGALGILYGPLLALLAGSLASAEERQLGTLEWQVLLPVEMWKQWMVKVATVMGLAVGVGLGLPALLAWMTPSVGDVRIASPLVVPVIAIAALGLYVSSLSASGVRALLWSMPVGFGCLLLAAPILRPTAWLANSPGVERLLAGTLASGSGAGDAVFLKSLLRVLFWLTPATLAGILTVPLVALLLRFAFVNHRSAERPIRRVSGQAASLAAGVVLALFVTVAVPRVGLAVIYALRDGRTRSGPTPATGGDKRPAAARERRPSPGRETPGRQ